MLDEPTPTDAQNEDTAAAPDTPDAPSAPPPRKRAPRKTTAKKAAAPAPDEPATAGPESSAEAAETPAETSAAVPARRTRKSTAKKTTPAEPPADAPAEAPAGGEAVTPVEGDQPVKKAPAKRTAKKTAAKKTSRPAADAGAEAAGQPSDAPTTAQDDADQPPAPPALLFQPPDPSAAKPAKTASKKKSTAKKTTAKKSAEGAPGTEDESAEAVTEAPAGEDEAAPVATPDGDESESSEESGEGGARRRRRRGGRRRRKGPGDSADGGETGEGSDSGNDGDAQDENGQDGKGGPADKGQSDADSEGGGTRRRRRRRRAGDGDDDGSEDPENTVTRVRKPRTAEDEITTFSGSTRLEAKKQRRREGREAGRRRAPIISEAEFLARRESVDRKMVIRQRGDLTQIAVMEDKVLVEHYVARESQTSLIGNVYLGRVQNVLPSMEAAFIDIGKGRNAVLYAGEVNWDALGAKDGNQRKIEQVLKPGQPVLVQVSKDPIGHKGARLTSQISLPGRFLVYVPDGTTSGISRKLPENERNRLKTLLKEIVPDTAGVIVRTAAEGASESELIRDVERLKALWEDIAAKVENGNAPQMLYGEPDLTLKVVRDLFTEDIGKLVVSGEEAWEMVQGYVSHVAPDLADRLEKHDDSERDAFAEYRIDEQINKALDRKVWLPSGGSLVIDRTEAMTVVDVNTGKFTGSGGNLEETVTKNNLEAAEEIVRQLRLRDIGGIIVIDFIDMVLENNRDLVLRRLIECLGRDRTRHQVAEVTSLGLVQMTRKRIGTGLLEAFSESCEACQGRGLHLHQEPVEQKRKQVEEEPRRNRRSRGRGKSDDQPAETSAPAKGGSEARRPTPAEFAAMARVEAPHPESSETADTADTAEAKEQPERQPEKQPEPQADSPTDAEQQPEPEPVAETVAEPVSPPPPPAAPRIVTSVRRVGARRPAGPPAGQAGTAVADRPTVEGATLDGATLDGPSLDGVAAGAGAEESVGSSEPSVDGAEGVDTAGQPHVPVKKKGARKR